MEKQDHSFAVAAGERYEYTGPYRPWLGLRGTVVAIVKPFENQYQIAQLEWDEAPGNLNAVFITPYNFKQWSRIDGDDPSGNDRKIYQAQEQTG